MDKNQAVTRTAFLPTLLRVDVSADMLNPDEDLWVTSRWQNAGIAPAAEPLYGFLDMEFGHQRTVEARDASFHRIRWEPYPGPHCWMPGEVWSTSCRCRIPGGATYWGGTYKLFIGICDGDGVPVQMVGRSGEDVMREAVGSVDSGWGWGVPSVELARKPWCVEINPPKDMQTEPLPCPGGVSIGENPAAILSAGAPALMGINGLEMPGFQPEVVLRDRSADALYYSFGNSVAVNYCIAEVAPDHAAYSGTVLVHGETAVQFGIRLTASEGCLTVGLERVNECGSFELLEVRFPALLAMGGDDVHLVDFYGGGTLVPSKGTIPIGYAHPYDARNAAALYDPRRMLVLEDKCLDDRLYAGVIERNGKRRAALGIALVHRIRAGGGLPSIPVGGMPCFEIALPGAGFGKPSWQAAARFLRRGISAVSLERYRRAAFTRYHVTQGPALPPGRLREDSPYGVARLAEVHRFGEVFEMVRRVHNLTDGAPQVVYVAGWQYRGFDTGYPYVLETDPRAGTPQELRRCIEDGRKYNALIALHDNYDDCYPSPHLDESIVAIDEDGLPWHGWIWAGGLSRIVGLPKYCERGFMQSRVRETVELYGIRETYHLDVLSSEVRHFDFDPACPAASGHFLEAKLQIIEEFNKYGIDVTSETVTQPFVGRIGYAASTRADHGSETLFTGGRSILLTPMIYHGSMRYDGAGAGRMGILLGILDGAGSGWTENLVHEAEYLSGYYLDTFPMEFLYDRRMLDVLEDGSDLLVDYGEDSHVKANLHAMTYEIAVSGRVLGKNFTSFAPGFRTGSWLAFSLDGGSLTYPSPDGWEDGCAVMAVALTAEGEGACIPCLITGGCIRIGMPAVTPVRVTKANVT